MVRTTKLSQQQKAILAELCDWMEKLPDEEYPDGYLVYYPKLSVAIAKRLDEEGDRIENQQENIRQLEYEGKHELAQISRQHTEKDEVLTAKHRSSFARSIRRLEERGFVERVPETKQDYIDGSFEIRPTTGDGYTKHVLITEDGKAAIEELAENDELPV